MRVEIDTEDFKDLEIAHERGWYRKKFFCPNCDFLIKIETWDRNYMFGMSTVLKDNHTPNFCPNCGKQTDIDFNG